MNIRKALTLLISAIVISALAAACGGNGAAQPAQPAAAPSQGEGNFKIELTTEPSPPTVGDVTFIVNLKDKSDQPVEGADVRVSYKMTTMGMSITSGTATDEGKGVYTIKSNVGMSGGLKIAIEVEKEGLGKGVKDVTLDMN